MRIDKKELIRILKDCRLCVGMAKSQFYESHLEYYCFNLIADIDSQIKILGGNKYGKTRKNKNKSN